MTALREFFESYYRLRPVNATFTGIHAHDHRLPDWSPDGLVAAADEMRALRRTLISGRRPSASSTAEPAEPAATMLRDVAVRDRELAISFLDVQLAEDATSHFQRGNASLALGEAAFGVISLITRGFTDAATRAEALIARLEAVPAFLAGAQRSMRAPIPKEWLIKCLRECDGVDILFRESIGQWIAVESLGASHAERLGHAAAHARTGLEDFRLWLSAGTTAGTSERYDCGTEIFDLLLARGHWCIRSRHDLGANAIVALDEALAALHEHAHRVAPGGWLEVQQRLADAHPTVSDYVATYQRVWDACRARAERHNLVTWPEAPLRYVPIPPHTRDAAPYLYYLFYRSPAPFDRLPVHDYVVTPIEPEMSEDEQRRRLRATNASVIKLNHVVHHGAIGHHVQNHHAYQGASEIGRVAAVDCASRVGMFLGGTMAEGWACYATDLMDEVGFLTPEESVSQQHTRARLLARAVVDIGLHSGSLTFDESVAVYRDRIGLSPEAAAAETCKNSMFPGAAIMYWLGTDGLHRLRRERERFEGAAFSLKRFHDRVLSFGSIPVPLLSQVW